MCWQLLMEGSYSTAMRKRAAQARVTNLAQFAWDYYLVLELKTSPPGDPLCPGQARTVGQPNGSSSAWVSWWPSPEWWLSLGTG